MKITTPLTTTTTHKQTHKPEEREIIEEH